MNELFFPVVGAMLVFFVVVPLLTLVARSAVALLPTTRDRVSAQESPWRFLLVVGPNARTSRLAHLGVDSPI